MRLQHKQDVAPHSPHCTLNSSFVRNLLVPEMIKYIWAQLFKPLLGVVGWCDGAGHFAVGAGGGWFLVYHF